MLRQAQHDNKKRLNMTVFIYRHSELDLEFRLDKEAMFDLNSGVKHQNDRAAPGGINGVLSS